MFEDARDRYDLSIVLPGNSFCLSEMSVALYIDTKKTLA